MTKLMQGRAARAAAATLLAATATVLTLFVAGCGDNAGNPTGYSPEGQASPAILLLDVQPFERPTRRRCSCRRSSPRRRPPTASASTSIPDEAGYRPANEAPLAVDDHVRLGLEPVPDLDRRLRPDDDEPRRSSRAAPAAASSRRPPCCPRPGYIPASDALDARRGGSRSRCSRRRIRRRSPLRTSTGRRCRAPRLPAAGVRRLDRRTRPPASMFRRAGPTPTELEVSVLNFVPYRWFVTGLRRRRAGVRALAAAPVQLHSARRRGEFRDEPGEGDGGGAATR